MKKRILLFAIIIFLFNACSVQAKMSPEIFFERMSRKNDILQYKNIESFNDKKDIVSLISDNKGTEYVFEFETTENGDIKKISLACSKTNKAENFIVLIKNIVSVYTPDENVDEILDALTQSGKINNGFSYFNTKWHSWSCYSDDNGLYFSVINNNLTESTKVEYSLKPNDKSGF